MKEIGGYIEYEYNHGEMLHGDAIHLNCARRAFSYLIKSHNIKKIWIPKLSCSSVAEPFVRAGCEYKYYSLSNGFSPDIEAIPSEEWIVIINYYGQIDNNTVQNIRRSHPKIIIDNTQAYFQIPIPDLDTIYSCRKYFGVTDGALLYTNSKLLDYFEKDESFIRMRYLMGRLERSASEFYSEYVENNEMFDNEPIKQMSKLTENILHGIDYNYIKEKRTVNFKYLHNQLKDDNELSLIIPDGPYMYPFYCKNGKDIRKKLQEEKIYIPTLWPDVFDICQDNEKEYDLAQNILPLPIDQRYGEEEMEYIVGKIRKIINK